MTRPTPCAYQAVALLQAAPAARAGCDVEHAGRTFEEQGRGAAAFQRIPGGTGRRRQSRRGRVGHGVRRAHACRPRMTTAPPKLSRLTLTPSRPAAYHQLGQRRPRIGDIAKQIAERKVVEGRRLQRERLRRCVDQVHLPAEAATGLVSAASIAIVLALDNLNDRLSRWRG